MIDSAEITIMAGEGGGGLASFRREKYVPKGGPDGGDGGKGGDIYLETDTRLNNLVNFTRIRKFYAKNGMPGQSACKHGKNGLNLVIKMPIGTIVYENNGGKFTKIVDLNSPDQRIRIGVGGHGGLGNTHFKSAINQAPRQFTTGIKGERKFLRLELKLLADVGLIGLPNAGKSTLLSIISNARPKIGNYPFTTIDPSQGIVEYKNVRFTVADMPGLIEGASYGKGLGLKFLKHIERTKVLVHLVSAQSDDWFKDYNIIRRELTLFSKKIIRKKELVVISKYDLVNEGEKNTNFDNRLKPVHITYNDRETISRLLDEIIKLLR